MRATGLTCVSSISAVGLSFFGSQNANIAALHTSGQARDSWRSPDFRGEISQLASSTRDKKLPPIYKSLRQQIVKREREMGFFGGKKSSVSSHGEVYIDTDGQPIPIAVAISPPSPKPGAMQVYYNESNNNHYATNEPKQGAVYRNGGGPQPILMLSRFPTVLKSCPVCQQRNARTRIVTAPDFFTWIAVAALLVVFWPLCWVPLVTDSSRRTTHYCLSCHAPVGSIRPFHDCCTKHR